MTQNTDFNLSSPEAIEAALGRQLEAIRLSRNLSQAALAREAGISLRTLTRMASGEGISLDTFIRVLRALGLIDRLQALLPDPAVRPIERVRRKGRSRRRASAARSAASEAWTWGDGDTE